ncbi:hypothetical protein LZC95_25000 [Pendulispora brunnea]|uniref:Uncharacterized protein n=1 Tax=Pendulispora brunnea TaxID=2905690 RepID=A0ABZ2KNF3_9BACT
MKRGLAAAAVVATMGLIALPTNAQSPTDQGEKELAVRATPVFGNEASMSTGWTEVAVSLENTGTAARKGTVELLGEASWARDEEFVARAPFNVTGGRSVVVKLPTHGTRLSAPNLSVRVLDPSGKQVGKASLGSIAFGAPLLVDVHQPSRLAPSLRNWPISTTWSPSRVPYASSMGPGVGLTVGVPTFDRATGDPILPDRAAGYAAATAVLIHTDVLARMEDSAAEALMNWVISGGTLALVPARADDLRGPRVTALVGGTAAPAPPPPVLLSLPTRTRPTDPGLFPTNPVEPDDDPPAPLHFVPIRTTEPSGRAAPGPSPAIRSRLQGYAGGNLAPSVYGASAAYGTGEVHLLAFDPTEAPMLDDAWAQGRLIDLLEHAWDRRAINVVAHGGGEYDSMNFDGVRRALDPNENFRLALGVAAILLVLYSIVCGPLVFLRAARKGKPLAPLVWAPIFSLVTFFTIVAVGFLVKGWHGRARHLAIVETGAGVSRGAIRRFRGFFTSESRALSVGSSDAASVLSVASADSSSSQERSALSVDRNGVTLEDINALPWQTIVVQEDGFHDFKGGVSIIAAKDGSLDVSNHTGRILKNVLVSVPGDGIHFVDRIADGASVHAADTQKLSGVLTTGSATKSATHTLSLEHILTGFPGKNDKHGEALRSAWGVMETALGGFVDWWPDQVPVVLAEVDGGEGGTARDANLPVESDRLLLRVIGKGGAP